MKFLHYGRRPRSILALLTISLVLAACGGDKPEAMVASARDFLAKNDSKAAIIQLKNALQSNPDLPEARFLLGQALLRTGDAVGGETELRKALVLQHPKEVVVPVLAQAMLAQRQLKKLVDEFGTTELGVPAAQASLKTSIAVAQGGLAKPALAQEALNAALVADPAYGPAVRQQARAKGNQGDFDGAIAQVDLVLTKSPNDHEALKLKGDLLMFGKKKPDEALQSYRKSLGAKPDFVEAHTAILVSLLREKKHEEAAKQLEALRQIAPNGLQTMFFDTMLALQRKDLKLAREKAQLLVRAAPDSPVGLQLAGAVELESNSLVQADAYLGKAVQLVPDALLPRRLLASTQMRAGQAAKALATIAPLLKQENLDGATNAVIGEIYLQNGDAKKAEEYFSKAIKLDPTNEKTRTSLALTQMAAGKDESGLHQLQEIAQSESGATATLALISTSMRRGDFDKALKAIDLLEKKQPGKPLAPNLRGRTLLAKKDVAGARKSFERSLEMDPAYFASVASLAALDMADKKPEEARKRFEAVLAKDPKNGNALLAIAELRARTGGSKEEVAELIGRAVAANPTDKTPRVLLVDFLLRTKDVKPALAAAQSAAGALPESPEVMDALGRAQQASGDLNQALAAFNKVATMQPLSPGPQMRLADAYMASKNKDAAAQSLRKALAIKPDLLEAQRGLIVLAVDSKNYEEGVRLARGMQKQNPKDAAGYQFEGDVEAAQKKWDVASEAYRNGLKRVQAPTLAVKLHGSLLAAGKAGDADKVRASWIKDNPKDVVFPMYLGDYASTHKDFSAAEKYYLGVLQLQPTNAVALNNLAWAAGKQNKAGAIAYAEKAVSLAPQQPAFMDTLAMLHSEKNDYAKALDWQTKALALAPQNSLYRLNLAKIHIKGGKKDLARVELDALAKLGDKFAGQAEVASLLKTL